MVVDEVRVWHEREALGVEGREVGGRGVFVKPRVALSLLVVFIDLMHLTRGESSGANSLRRSWVWGLISQNVFHN